MENMERQGYIAQEWNESKSMGSSAKEVLPLADGGKLEMYAQYMLHHYIGYDKTLRVMCYPYDHIATYQTARDDTRLTLYTKEIHRMVELVGSKAIWERVLSFVGRELLSLEEYIVSLYGESGRLLYPKNFDPYTMEDNIRLYENYLRADNDVSVSILPYHSIRTVEVDYECALDNLITFSVCGETALGGYSYVMMLFKSFSRGEIDAYLKIIQKLVLKKQKKLIVARDGCGEVVTKLFYRESGEKPLEAPMALCHWSCNTTLFTFYPDRFSIKRYAYSKETPSGEERTVAYGDLLHVSFRSMAHPLGKATVYEIALMIRGQKTPVTVLTNGARGREGYKHVIDVLKKYAPEAFLR